MGSLSSLLVSLKTEQIGPSDTARGNVTLPPASPFQPAEPFATCFGIQRTWIWGLILWWVMGQRVIIIHNLQEQQSGSCGQDFLRDTRCAICKQMTIDYSDQLIMSLQFPCSWIPHPPPQVPILEVSHRISFVCLQVISREDSFLSSAFSMSFSSLLASPKLCHKISKGLSAYCIVSSSSESSPTPIFASGCWNFAQSC